DDLVTGVQTCALPISLPVRRRQRSDPSQHAAKTLPRQMPFGQQQPVIARVRPWDDVTTTAWRLRSRKAAPEARAAEVCRRARWRSEERRVGKEGRARG